MCIRDRFHRTHVFFRMVHGGGLTRQVDAGLLGQAEGVEIPGKGGYAQQLAKGDKDRITGILEGLGQVFPAVAAGLMAVVPLAGHHDIAGAVVVLAHVGDTVSYTHLDVYKRQPR